MKYPGRTKYAWVNSIRGQPFPVVLAVLLLGYVAINALLATLYFNLQVLMDPSGKVASKFLDYVYFSFVTSLTIGYGDFRPFTDIGKIIVIVHACVSALYFAGMVAILSIKLFYPRDTVVFCEKILYNPKNKTFGFRFLNIHRSSLINPEVRVYFTEHGVGNIISRTHSLGTFSKMPYLGKHDFILHFQDRMESESLQNESMYSHWSKAVAHDSTNNVKSRFRVMVSVEGNYGFQQFACFRKYYPNEIFEGHDFAPIQYNDEDQRKMGNIQFAKFPNFWKDFNKILQ